MEFGIITAGLSIWAILFYIEVCGINKSLAKIADNISPQDLAAPLIRIAEELEEPGKKN